MVDQTTSSCFNTEVGRVALFLSALNTAEGQSPRIFLAPSPKAIHTLWFREWREGWVTRGIFKVGYQSDKEPSVVM